MFLLFLLLSARAFLFSGQQDELTLDNISRSGLVNMCRYMGLAPFGSDNFLRFQLRAKLRAITQVHHCTTGLRLGGSLGEHLLLEEEGRARTVVVPSLAFLFSCLASCLTLASKNAELVLGSVVF